MQVLAVPLSAIGFALAVVLLFREHYVRRQELKRMEKLRGSRLYADLYPAVRRCRAYDLDQVRVERDRVVITTLNPCGTLAVFSPPAHGYPLLSEEGVRVLSQVLAEDIEALRDRTLYRITRYSIFRAENEKDHGYVYTARPAYKARALRKRMDLSFRI